jgi:glycosyltransferase involved in cell wall biosynthesis
MLQTPELILLIAFGMVAAIQLFYHFRFFRLLAFHRAEPQTQTRQHAVTVIICTRDEAANLAVNLPGVLLQDYPSTCEVLVVNDNSVDETRYLLEELHRQFRQLRVVELKQEAMHIPGKKYPLSVGVKSAKHEILLMTDADCVPATEWWVLKMQEAYKDGIEIVLGYGGYQKRKGILNALIRFETFHTALQYLSYALAGMPYMGVGRNLSYKREIFFRHKGFTAHNHIPGGDDDLFINMAANRHNTAVVIDKDAFTISKPKTRFAEWVRQKYRHYSTGRHYQPKHRFLLGLYSASQFLVYPLFVVCLLTAGWQIALGIFALRLLVQAFIYYKAMDKLDEKNLWPWFWLLDVWSFFYYLIFIPALWKKPKQNWN